MILDDNGNVRFVTLDEIEAHLVGAGDGIASLQEAVWGGLVHYDYLDQAAGDRTPGLAVSRASGRMTRDIELMLASRGIFNRFNSMLGAGDFWKSLGLAAGTSAADIWFFYNSQEQFREGYKQFTGGGYLAGSINMTLGTLGMLGPLAGPIASELDDLGAIRSFDTINPPKAEVPRGDASPRLLLERGRVADHHIFPRQFDSYFRARGIVIDDFTITLGEKSHLRGVHGGGLGEMPGGWNARWATFIRENPTASRKETFQFAGSLMDEYGVSHVPIHPYRQ